MWRENQSVEWHEIRKKDFQRTSVGGIESLFPFHFKSKRSSSSNVNLFLVQYVFLSTFASGSIESLFQRLTCIPFSFHNVSSGWSLTFNFFHYHVEPSFHKHIFVTRKKLFHVVNCFQKGCPVQFRQSGHEAMRYDGLWSVGVGFIHGEGLRWMLWVDCGGLTSGLERQGGVFLCCIWVCVGRGRGFFWR